MMQFISLTGAGPYGQILDTPAALPGGPVNLPALTASGKLLLRSLDIPVDLPKSDKFTTFILMIHEPDDVLRRIAEKESDLVREIHTFTDPGSKMSDACIHAFAAISHPRQHAPGGRSRNILFQSIGSVDIDKGAFFGDAERYGTKTFADKYPVHLAYILTSAFLAIVSDTDEICGLDSRQRR